MLGTLGRQSTLCLGCLSRILRVPTCRAAPQLTGVHSQPVRLAKSWVKRRENQKLRDDTVFQYASKNTKRAQRIYGWGLAAAGALGKKRNIYKCIWNKLSNSSQIYDIAHVLMLKMDLNFSIKSVLKSVIT